MNSVNNKYKKQISTKSKKGITMIALIITIIVMLILIGVTLNITLNENGIISTTKNSSMEQEKQTILEQMIALADCDNSGHIKVADTYNRVTSEFKTTIPTKNTDTDKRFKVKGQYGEYGYKITTEEIAVDDSTEDPAAPGELGSFTFEEIDASIDVLLKNSLIEEMENSGMNDEEIKAYINENFEEIKLNALKDLIAIQPMDETGAQTVTMLFLPPEIFWPVVGKSYIGQYGVVMDGQSQEDALKLRNPNKTITTDSNEFSEKYTGSTNNTTNMFVFGDAGNEGVLFYLSKAGNSFSAILSVDGKGLDGNDSNEILSWNEFISEYGKIKFTFSNQGIETYYVKEYFYCLANEQDINAIEKGKTYEQVLTADEGYVFPTEIQIEMNGKELTEGIEYTWTIGTDAETGVPIGTITIQNVTGNLNISAEGTYNTAWINYNTNGIDGNNFINQTTKGSEFSTIFTPYENYVLPQTIEITMLDAEGNQNTLTEGMDYTWNPSTGELVITNVTGDVHITAYAEEGTLNINWSLNIDYANSIAPTSIARYGQLECMLKAYEGNTLPEKILVEMNGEKLIEGLSYTYNRETGELIIPSVTGHISIQDAVTFSITLDLKNVTASNDNNLVEQGETYSNIFTANQYYLLPQTITVEQNGENIASEDFSWNPSTGELTVPNIRGNLVVKIIGQASEDIYIGKVFSNEEVQAKLNATGGTYNGDWEVIGIDQNGIKIVTMDDVKESVELGYTDPDAKANISVADENNLTEEEKRRRAAWSYAHAVEKLDRVAQIETGIDTARSITIEDIYSLGNGDIYNEATGRGEIVKYYCDSTTNGKVYRQQQISEGVWSEEKTDMTELLYTNDKGEILTIGNNSRGEVILTDNYTSISLNYSQKQSLHSLSKQAFYWIASPVTIPSYDYNDVDFGVMHFSADCIWTKKLFNGSSLGLTSSAANPVRAVTYI